jgi:hypothetical protein
MATMNDGEWTATKRVGPARSVSAGIIVHLSVEGAA